MGKPKKWNIGFSRVPENKEISAIAGALGIQELTASLLYHRGCKTPEQARRFVRMEEAFFHDPFLLRDMDLAARRLNDAIACREPILVWGDYDADGVTATSVLYLYLKKCGAEVDYFIPDRIRDGYGMNERAVREAAERGIKLIVTVDNGITATGPIALAYELGMEVIVTDHHEPHGELPSACAVVNPHREDCPYPFKELAGVGVAFKLICAAEAEFLASEGKPIDTFGVNCFPYLDLVAIGTVADVMSLSDENRLIVGLGLRLLTSDRCRYGLKALIEQALGGGKRISAASVSFTLAPRINAAGRMGSAMRAAELLLCDSEFEASRLAAELCDLNRERQTEENEILLSAEARISQLAAEDDFVFVLDHDDWHPGVTGIVSSRITERYGRPSFLITYDGNIGKGSGRSVEGVNLMELLSACSDLLVQYGGHEMAAGLTVERENVPNLRKRLNTLARDALQAGLPEASLYADCEISLADVTCRNIEELGLLEPCGTDNAQPLFVLRDCEIFELAGVGNNRHTRLKLKTDGRPVTAMYFGVAPDRLDYAMGDHADLLVQMELNEFGGNITPQLLVRDMDHAAREKVCTAKHEEAFSAFLSKAAGELPLSALPDRSDFARTYRYLRRVASAQSAEMSFRALSDLLFYNQDKHDARWKCALILHVFSETNLLTAEEIEIGIADSGSASGHRLRITVPDPGKKVELSTSELYRRIEALHSAGSEEQTKGEPG